MTIIGEMEEEARALVLVWFALARGKKIQHSSK